MLEEGNIKMSFSYNYIKKCVSLFSHITAVRMFFKATDLRASLSSLINFCSTKEFFPFMASAIRAAPS